MKNTIISIVCTVLLIIGIIVEIVVGVKMFKNERTEETEQLIQYAMERGKSNISVKELFNFPDAPAPSRKGDVISIGANRFRIDGTMTDDSNTSMGYIYYATLDTQEPRLLTYKDVDSNVTEFHVALNSYLSGLPDDLVKFIPVATRSENLTYYQQNYVEGVIPVIYDDASEQYYMFLDCGSFYYIIYAKDTFCLTDARLTVHYSDAADDHLRSHEFNTYEVGAVTNTRNQLSDGSYDGDPIKKGSASSTADTYTSKDDDDVRNMLVAYSKYDWLSDGTSNDTRMLIDITSAEAKKSEWVLTETQYAYNINGLTLNGMYAKRTPSLFTVEGDLTNTIDAERPWVMVIKFMDRNGGLLGLKVLDNRNIRLAAKGTTRFSCDLGSSEGIDIDTIYAIQFEVR